MLGSLLSGVFGLFSGGGGNTSGIASGNDKSTTTTTTSNTEYTDSRSVYDTGGGQFGEGNAWYQSADTNTTDSRQWFESSFESSADNSTRTNTDSGNVNWTYTDGGANSTLLALGAQQQSVIGSIATGAANLVTGVTQSAIDAVTSANSNVTNLSLASLNAALGAAERSQQMSYSSSNAALGMAGETFASLAKLSGEVVGTARKQADEAAGNARDALTTSGDLATGNRTLVLVGIGAVALVVAFQFWGKQ